MTEIEKYNLFIKALELEEIILSELNVKRYSDLENGQWAANLEPTFSLIEKNDEKIKAAVKFDITVSKQDDVEKKLFSINIKFLIIYSMSEKVEITEQMLERFINTNLPLNIWPYGRELISSISTKMGFPALLIGTFKVA